MAFKGVVKFLLGVCLICSVALAHAIESAPRHLVFASDTQYPWTDKSDSGEPENGTDFEKRAKWLVDSQLGSIAGFRNAHGGQAKVPLMINGDITAFGHGWQRSYMKSALEKYFKGDYLYGLGNHDYENNVDDCFTNSCAAGSIVEFKEHHFNKVDNFDLKVTGGFLDILYSGSLAYSKDVGDVHLVQLNNEPTYTTKISHVLNPTTFNITSALDWLETDLRVARASGYAIIINMHKWDRWQGGWQQEQRFLDMIEKYEVTAIFAGHYHTRGGGKRWMGKVPMFLSGATSQQTYLTASLSDDRKQLHVNLIENNDWQKPYFVDTVPVKSIWTSRP